MAKLSKLSVIKVVAVLVAILVSLIIITLIRLENRTDLSTTATRIIVSNKLPPLVPSSSEYQTSLATVQTLWSKYIVPFSAVGISSAILFIALTVLLVLYYSTTDSDTIIDEPDDNAVDDFVVPEPSSSDWSVWSIFVYVCLPVVAFVILIYCTLISNTLRRWKPLVKTVGGTGKFDIRKHLEAHNEGDLNDLTHREISKEDFKRIKLELINEKWATFATLPQRERVAETLRISHGIVEIAPNTLTFEDDGNLEFANDHKLCSVLDSDSERLVSLYSLLRGESALYLREKPFNSNVPFNETFQLAKVIQSNVDKFNTVNLSRIDFMLAECLKTYAYYELTFIGKELAAVLPMKQLVRDSFWFKKPQTNSDFKVPIALDGTLSLMKVYKRDMSALVEQGKLLPYIYFFVDDTIEPDQVLVRPPPSLAIKAAVLPVAFNEDVMDGMNPRGIFTLLKYARFYADHLKTVPNRS